MQFTIKLILVFGFVSWSGAFPNQPIEEEEIAIKDNENGKNSTNQYDYANLIGLDDGGKTPLHYAAEKGDLNEAHSYLTNGAWLNITDDSDETPLHYAAEHGNTQIAKLYIANGAVVDAKDSLGATPLFYAVHKDHFETSELLLKKGANASVTISNRKKQNLSILHLLAARERRAKNTEKIAELLIAHGANVNAMDSRGKTPLMVSIERDKPKMVELFIKHGADVNLLDDGKCLRWTPYICRGGTALHWAVRLERMEFVEMLTKNGANVNIKDAEGQTPLEMATEKASYYQLHHNSYSYGQCTKIAEILKNAGATESLAKEGNL